MLWKVRKHDFKEKGCLKRQPFLFLTISGYEILISLAGLGFTSSFFGSVIQRIPSLYFAEIFSPST